MTILDINDIKEEFNALSSVNYKDHYTIGYIYGTFGNSNNMGERFFGFIKKSSGLSSLYETNRWNKILMFSETLFKNGNIKYAKKISGIGYYSANYYMKFLNDEALKRGLPPVFVKKIMPNLRNAKLTEKQVGYIKYLVTKYSTFKVAEMYGVSQSAISLIKMGLTWKNVLPSILNTTPLKIINQYITVKDELISDTNTKFVYPDKVLNETDEFYWTTVCEKLRWKGNIICPICDSDRIYNLKYLIHTAPYECGFCKTKFNVYNSTIFSNKKTDFYKFAQVIGLLLYNINTSTYEICRKINVTQKTAWKIKSILSSNLNIEITDPLKQIEYLLSIKCAGNKNAQPELKKTKSALRQLKSKIYEQKNIGFKRGVIRNVG